MDDPPSVNRGVLLLGAYDPWRKQRHSGHRNPPWRRLPLGVPLAGLGEGVGDCRGAVITQSGVLFGSSGVLYEG